MFTSSPSYDVEETVYLIGATVIRYLKCSRIKSVREMFMQTYSGIFIFYLFFFNLSNNEKHGRPLYIFSLILSIMENGKVRTEITSASLLANPFI